jgi:hypothetical protein
MCKTPAAAHHDQPLLEEKTAFPNLAGSPQPV